MIGRGVGVAAVGVLLLLSVVGHAVLSRATRSRTPGDLAAVSNAGTEPLAREVLSKKWAIRLSSFDEVGDVTLPAVSRGVVRGFPTVAACEDAIRPGLQRYASQQVGKLPAGG